MNPTQPQPTPTPPPLTYLDQIAPQAPKKQVFKPGLRLVIIIAIALVVLVSILSIVVTSISTGQRRPMQQLAARLESTATVVDGAQKSLKSSQLRSLNSNLDIYLTDTNREIGAPLLAAGVNTAKISDSIKEKESSTELASRLEDARLNAIYDRTYAREMTYLLDTILTLMKQIYSSTSNEELKAFLTAAYTNLQPTQKSFSEFDATK